MSASPEVPSAWKAVSGPLSVLVVMGVIGASMREPSRPAAPQAAPTAPVEAQEAPEPPPLAAEPSPAPVPAPTPAPVLDTAAVEAAEARLAAAVEVRQKAERRAAEAEERYREAETHAAFEEQLVRDAEARLDEPSAQLEELRQRGDALMAETDSVRSELNSLAAAPRPRRKPLVDKTPVARPAEGEEVHFELRRERVTYIDLDRLVDRLKSDAQLQLRLMAGSPSAGTRPVTSSVGPVGAFAMRYELGRSLPASMRDLMEARGVTFTVLGYELVPVRDLRGEPLERLGQPASDFQRVLNSISPSHATITLWVYPDSFRLYRQLNEYLHKRGFQVAARPLPNGMAIRGSPSGSISATQ